MNGVVLPGMIRQRADAARLPLILVTSAQPSQTETPPGLFAAVILKPLRNLQFAAAVAQVLLGPKAPRTAAGKAGRSGRTRPPLSPQPRQQPST